MKSGPLAYAFWHWKREAVSRESYEASQCAFQKALAAEPPPGFLRATTVRLTGAGWAASGGAAYEDWYLVDDMAALGSLNDAAVTGSRQGPHDAVARLAAGGIAGLYGCHTGTPLALPGFASWFAKPEGMSYQVLNEALGPEVDRARGALWSRRMTLGPTPEFCLHSLSPVELPAAFQTQRLTLEPVWMGPG